MTRRAGVGTTAAALALTLATASWAWAATLSQVTGMDMGVATRLGAFPSFLAVWVTMMAAMMLPGAAPATMRHARVSGRVWAAPVFVGSYLAVWALVEAAVYVVYRPHEPLAAGLVVGAAGLYELTPLKRHFRRRCSARVRSGLDYGICCVGSSIGLMLLLVALGVMSLVWMSVTSAVVLGQKLLPARAALDVPLALALVGLGAWVALAPSSVPALVPPM